jgi:putative aldouronate transport system substrate-binding protein
VETGLIRAPLLQHVMTESLRFILGQRPFSEWDAYVDECDALDAPKYLEIIQGAQQRFAETRG